MVGADGTRQCEPALLWAAGEAACRWERLVIVHARERRVPHKAPYARSSAPDDLANQQVRGPAVLDRAVALVRDRFPDVPVEGRLVEGRPESVLAELARGADLLVLGSAAQLAGDGRLGAVLLSCLRWPPCPVVVVPATRLGSPQPVRGELAEAR